MAQYTLDCTNLDDWSEYGEIGASQYSIDGTAGHIFGSDTHPELLTATGPSADSTNDDVDVVFRMRAVSTNSSWRFFHVRFSGPSSSYAIGRGGSTSLRIYLDGASIASVDDGLTFNTTDYFWCRFQVIGTALKAKNWSGNLEDEPASWLIDTTDSSRSGTGAIGFGSRGTDGGLYLSDCYVGTDSSSPYPVAGAPTLSAATLVPAGGNTYQPRVTYTF